MAQLILIVDDDQMNRELLEIVFQRAGYRVNHANSGGQALRAVAAELPDLILLDVRLGEVSGYDICTQIKGDAATQSVPIIMLSAADSSDEYKNAVNAGADAFFPKLHGWQRLLELAQSKLPSA